MKKKLLALGLAATMVVSMTACGGSDSPATVTATPTPGSPVQVTATPTPAPTATEAPAPTVAPKKEASINFEDGNIGFAEVYMQHALSGETELSVGSFNNSQALKIQKVNANKNAFVGIDVYSLLGEKAADVATVEMSVGIEYADGTFSACSGKVYFWSGTKTSEMASVDWSVYMANKNPKVCTFAVPEEYKFSAENSALLFQLNTDNGAADHGGATVYIDDVTFLDASGKTITADTTVAFAAPAGFKNEKPDRSNLNNLVDAVSMDFNVSGGGWSQAGVDMTQEFIDALVPGSTIEITYSSADGTIWFVFPGAAAGWSRVGDGKNCGNDHTGVYVNDSKTVAQLDYDQIVAICGEDKSTWGTTIQCEAREAWEVYSIKVGMPGAAKEFVADVEFEGFQTSAGGWSQNGFDMPQAVIDALVPGSVIEVNYTSADGTLWLVFPGAAAGWSRVADGDFCGNGHAAATLVDGSKCYVTYEQIVEVCGEDKSTWGTTLQCEAREAWEAYSLKVGKFVETSAKEYSKQVEFEGFQTSAGGWSQNGFDMPQAVIDALVPGSVIEVNYTSADGTLWLVFPGAAAGWSRVADGDFCGNGHAAATLVDGSKCYVTYEQIVEVCGEDKSTWGTTLQCEAREAWEVYSVSVGTMKDAVATPRLRDFTEFEGFQTSAGGWSQNGFDMPQAVIDALVPGSVIEVSYTSADGTLWLVLPGATAGWSRVGDGDFCGNGHEAAVLADGKCYVTYEQIAAICGEDKSTWGTTLQCEARDAWEVYSLRVGQR